MVSVTLRLDNSAGSLPARNIKDRLVFSNGTTAS